MKKLITLLLFVMIVSVNSEAQTAGRKYEHVIVSYYGIHISIDYGNNREEKFKDIMKAKSKNKYSMTDALNYMDEQGYELISSHATSPGVVTTEYYIFRREIKK